MEGVSQRLLMDASETDTAVTTGAPFRHVGVLKTVHTINWHTGVSTGEVTIEAADKENWTGDWKVLQVVTFSGTAPYADVVPIEGCYGAFRHRITAPINDGAVVWSKIRGAL